GSRRGRPKGRLPASPAEGAVVPRPRDAGDLTARVKFQRRAAAGDDYGNPVAGWEDLGVSRACALTPTRGGEQVQAGRIAGTAGWDCWVRSDAGTRSLRTGDRAVGE